MLKPYIIWKRRKAKSRPVCVDLVDVDFVADDLKMSFRRIVAMADSSCKPF